MASAFVADNPLGPGTYMGMNSLFPRSYGKEFHTNDLMKQASAVWLRNSNDTFDGTVNADGWITGPGTATTHNQVVVLSNSRAGMLPLGDYVMTWDGTGDCDLITTGTMAIGTPAVTANRKVYTVTDWGADDKLYLRIPIASTDVTNVQLCHIDYEGTCQLGDANVFYHRFLEEASKFKGGIFRPMNLIGANHKKSRSTWAGRKPATYRTWADRYVDGDTEHAELGWPIEALVELQNTLQTPMWYCLNTEYDDASVTSYAQYIAQNSTAGLLSVFETGNEVWNSLFVANAYAQAQGLLDVAATRYVTLSGMADSAFNGNYIQSQFGELGATFDTTASTTHMFRRESGGTFYCLYHSTVTGDWEAAEVGSDPDGWVNSESVTTVKSETVTSADDTWTEDSTIGPDAGDANVDYYSAYKPGNSEAFPYWPWYVKRGGQMMDLVQAAFEAEGRGADLAKYCGLQIGSAESKNSIDVDVSETPGLDTPVPGYTKFDALGGAWYMGNGVLYEPQYSNNGAADDAPGSLREGATKNTINMTDQEIFDYLDQILDTYEQNVATATSWAWWANEIKTVRGKEMWGYEGGHHITRGVTQTTRTDEIIALTYDDPRAAALWGKMVTTAYLYFDVLEAFVWVQDENRDDNAWGHFATYADSEDYDNNPRLQGFGEMIGLRRTRSI
jgi:hypothetical protein